MKQVANGTRKLIRAILTCRIERARGKLANDTAEDACESKAEKTFTRTPTTGCAGCTDLTTIAAGAEAAIDANNDKIYCGTSGTPFGGDDSGNVPPDAATGPMTKCANRVAKGVGRLVKGSSNPTSAMRAAGFRRASMKRSARSTP